MTWIKICGITNLEDALTAVEAGADALGFVFYEKSPRNINSETAREIVAKLPEKVEKVGVFVGIHSANFLPVVHQAGLTACQLCLGAGSDRSHNQSAREETATIPAGFKIYRSIPANWFAEDRDRMRDFVASFTKVERLFISAEQGHAVVERFRTVFIDSSSLEQPGGTGKTFDWEKIVPVAETMREGGLKLVVAGGLTPENVCEAMRILKPWGVDVSSGVEARPGKKNPEKIRAFIEAVRRADGKN